MSVVAERMKKHMALLREYEASLNCGVRLNLQDVSFEELVKWKNNEDIKSPVITMGESKMPLSEFRKTARLVDRKVEVCGDHYRMTGRRIKEYDTADKWSPNPVYEDVDVEFWSEFSLEELIDRLDE